MRTLHIGSHHSLATRECSDKQIISIQCRFQFEIDFTIQNIPLAILHQGSVIYVRKAFSGTDCARRVSFQKWKVCVNPRIVHSGL